MLPDSGGDDASLPLLYVEPEKRGACLSASTAPGFEAGGGATVEVLAGSAGAFGLGGSQWRATICCANHMGDSVRGGRSALRLRCPPRFRRRQRCCSPCCST